MRFGWLCLGLAACGGGGASDAASTDGGSISDTGSVPDTGTAEDTGTAGPRLGTVLREGSPTVDGDGWVGTESFRFLGEDGAVLCDVSYTLSSVAPRADCTTCLWAFDLVLSDATLIADPEGLCLPTLGVDAATVGTLDGRTEPRGYNDQYFGHAKVLMIVVDGEWKGGDYADWDETTGLFEYQWDDGGHPY